MIASGTLEELIYARQMYKQQQANIAYEATSERRFFKGVDGDRNNRGELFGCKNLFKLQDGAVGV